MQRTCRGHAEKTLQKSACPNGKLAIDMQRTCSDMQTTCQQVEVNLDLDFQISSLCMSEHVVCMSVCMSPACPLHVFFPLSRFDLAIFMKNHCFFEFFHFFKNTELFLCMSSACRLHVTCMFFTVFTPLDFSYILLTNSLKF